MAESVALVTQPREGRGSQAARRLRRKGIIPAVIYGHKEETLCVALSAEDTEKAIRRGVRVVDLKANGNFIQLQNRITDLEEKIADRREFFNDDVNTYNIRIQEIPDVAVAGLMHLERKDLFKVAEEDRRDVEVKFA